MSCFVLPRRNSEINPSISTEEEVRLSCGIFLFELQTSWALFYDRVWGISIIQVENWVGTLESERGSGDPPQLMGFPSQ